MTRWIPWAVLAVTGLVHASSLFGEQVWDDVLLIVNNPALHTLSGTFDAAFSDFFAQSAGQPSSGFLRPVPVVLNGITYAAFGAEAWPYHLTNWLLHLLAVGLVFRLFVAVGLSAIAAGIGAAILGLHPMSTESVAFISGRTDLLAAVGMLATTLCYLRARRQESLPWALGTSLAFVFAAGSKEVALVLPIALGWMEWAGLAAPAKGRLRALAPLAAAFASVVVLRLVSDVEPIGRMYFEAASTPTAALNLVSLYGGLLLWPIEQRVLYDHLPIGVTSAVTFAGGIIVVAVGVAVFRLRTRAPHVACALVWVAITIIPVLHLIPLPALAAERYLYLPLVGLGWLAAAAVQRAQPHWRWVAVAALMGCASLTAARSLDWHDEVSLWMAETEQRPSNYKALQNLAIAFADRKEWDLARAAIYTAWHKHPNAVVWRNLIRIDLATPGSGLSSSEKRAFRGVALVANPDLQALRSWMPRLEQARHPFVANAIKRLLKANARTTVPTKDSTRP